MALKIRSHFVQLQVLMMDWKRKNPLLVRQDDGQSGCVNIQMFTSSATHAWAAKAEFRNLKNIFSWHVSCQGKMNEGIPDMFIGDLLDFLQYRLEEQILYRQEPEEYKYIKTNPAYNMHGLFDRQE